MVTIVDYNLGNVGSIANMLAKIGVDHQVSSSPEDIVVSDKVILPGVGAFDEGVKNLEDRQLRQALDEFALHQKKPVLGICLGMQLMAQSSKEGALSGLGWIPLKVKAFSDAGAYTSQVPAMGWNYVSTRRENMLLTEPGSRFYFVHSFYFEPNEFEIISASIDGFEYCAGFQDGNIYGVQFHPEKSHRYGLALLTNFCEV